METLISSLFDWRIFFPLAFGFLIYTLTKRDSRQNKFLKSISGPPTIPLLGNGWSLLVPNYELISLIGSWYKKYGKIFRVWIGNQPIVLLCGSSEVEALLSSNVHIEKSREYEMLFKWLGLGLLTAKPKKWFGRRKLLTPAFHFKILEEFTQVFNEQGNVFIEVLKKKSEEKKAFDIFPFITRCALDIICETAMGKKLHAQEGKANDLEYVKAVYEYGDILVKKFAQPWLQVGLIWNILGYGGKERYYVKTLHSFTQKVIAERKRERKEFKPKAEVEIDEFATKRKKAFLDLLLDLAEEDKSLTDTEIREETDTFMFEGHDTTAANMAWTVMTMSQNPQCQKKVQEELDALLGEDRDRDITAADISKMKYLECCIKESLRLYPSVPFYFRNLSEDLPLSNNRIIPKGVSVAVADIFLHRDPSVFPNPEEFNPDRFLPENSLGRSPFAYVPFSAGPRNCIGQKFALLEEKIVLAKFFLNYNVKAGRDLKDVLMVPDIILRPLNGVLVEISKR